MKFLDLFVLPNVTAQNEAPRLLLFSVCLQLDYWGQDAHVACKGGCQGPGSHVRVCVSVRWFLCVDVST